MRYFASLREALGAGETLDVDDWRRVASLRDALAGRGGRHLDALGSGRVVRSARNRALCADSTALSDGDEVAFFPPVTGG